MKKEYQAPVVLIETYKLNQSIANHCGEVVHNGPALGDHEECDDWREKHPFDFLSLGNDYYTQQSSYNVLFYEDVKVCDCYTTGNGSFWTS